MRSITSLQWMEDYFGPGEVKLVCAGTTNNLRLLTEGVLIRNPDRPHLLAKVQSVEVADDMEDAKMTVRAKMTVCRLEERVLMYTAQLANAEEGMLRMVSDNLRGLPIHVAPAKGLPQRYDGQISWGSVLDAEIKVAQRCGLGFRVRTNEDLSETFEVYRGTDRTDPASPAYVGYLSDRVKNLSDIRIGSGENLTYNVAIVAGEGQGADRRVVEVDLSAGQPRREIYVNASDVSSSYRTTQPDGSQTEHTLSPEGYTEALRERGVAAIAESLADTKITAELRQSMILFSRDYDLGDILPLRVEKYGIEVNVQLSRVTIIYEQTKTIKATLEVVAK